MKSSRALPESPRLVLPAGREADVEAEPQAYAFGPFQLVPGERILRRGPQVLPLPPKPFETLLLLLRNSGHLMRKEDLMRALWPDSFVEEASLASAISLLRKALEEAGGPRTYIQTVPKEGYRFLPAVTRIWAAAPPEASVRAGEAPAERVIRFMALPFPLLNADERIEFLGQSLPEAIAASLAGLRSLTVRSSLLAARLAEGKPDPRQIAQEAEIDMLLAGKIVCDGDELQISAELVHAPSGTLIGSYACRTRRDNVIAVQESLVRGIVEMLMLRLGERERRILTHNVPASARAYEFYLRANHIGRERTCENLALARDLYRECLDEDPDYAPAWARLGRCYRFLEKFGQEAPQGMGLAQWAFHRAFALSPDLPIAHNLYTSIEADAGHACEAMGRLLAQAARHPNDPELFGGLVQACRYCGLLRESIRAHERARRLDSRIVTSVAHTYFLLGDFARAPEWYPPGVHAYMDAAAIAAAGREREAAELLGRRRSPGGQFPALTESLYRCLQGDYNGSLEIAREALAQGTMEPEMRFYTARHMARDGAHAEALAAIRRLAAEGFYCAAALRGDPWLRPLDRLAEFEVVLEEVLRREADSRTVFETAGGDKVLSR